MTLEKEGDLSFNHKHKWIYDSTIIYTNPPIRHKICKLCGRVEHESEKYIEFSNFDEIYEKFHD